MINGSANTLLLCDVKFRRDRKHALGSDLGEKSAWILFLFIYLFRFLLTVICTRRA